MKALLLFVAIWYSISGAFGQELIKSIGNTAKEKANARDFNTTRNNKERSNLQQEKNRSLKESESAPAPAPGAGTVQAETPAEPSGDYQASYTFSSSVTYRIEMPKKEHVPQDIQYSFGEQVIKMQVANQDMSSIIDSKNGVMIMLNNKDKTATVMSTRMMEMAMKQQAMNQGSEKPAAKITKTGRTKIILGYKCEEIIIETDKKTEAWVTSEAGIDVSNVFTSMAKNAMSQVPPEAFSGGVLMEMTAYDAQGNAEMHMLMTILSKETSVVNIGSYKITKL